MSSRLSQFSRNTKLLIATSAIMATSFFGIYTLLRVLYILRLGYGPEYVGVFGAAGAFTYMGMGLPSGVLGRRFGLRRSILMGGIVTLAGMVTLPVAEFLPAHIQAFWPISSQVLHIAGWSMFNVNLVPALMATTEAKERNSAYALNGVLKGIGAFLGTTVGGALPGLFAKAFSLALDTPRPYGYGIWVGAAVGLVALIPLTRLGQLERPIASGQKGARAALPLVPLALMFLYVCLSHSAWSVSRAFGSAYMDTVLTLPASSIGLITGVGQFVAIAMPLLNPLLGRRHGHGWTLAVTTLGMGVSTLPLALVPNWAGAGIGCLGVFVFSAMWLPALQIYQMEQVEERWRSVAYGISSMAMACAFASASLVGGYVVAARGYRTLFLAGAVVGGLGAAVMWGSLHARGRRAVSALSAAGRL